jgi:hypothetical protein
MKLNCLDNRQGETRDVIIATVPWTDTAMPLMAPAVLKPIVEKAGLTCLAIDLNAEVYDITKQHPDLNLLIKFFFDEEVDPKVEPWLHDMFVSIATSMLSWKPKIIGLSLFSYVCQHSTKWLAYYIRKLDPDVKIVVGGAGCVQNFTGPADFVDDLQAKGLVDYHIRGDGENSFYELLRGNISYTGINSDTWKELDQDELRSLPMPNYQDYQFHLYEKKALALIGSRGCVRKCTFCDSIANWTKFQWRLADDIFAEMLHQYGKYGIRYFKFQDSLTNGNMKEFTRLTELMAKHNQDNPDKSFRWSGYYIFRDVTPSSDREWELVYLSGAEFLAVGIENLNEHIRYALGKKFTNASIDYHLVKAKQYGIQIQMLNIVGYVNETEKDIEFAKQWLREHLEFRDTLLIQWGGTLGIFPNTALERDQDKLGIVRFDRQPQSWINPAIGSTPAVRARWAKELNEVSTQLGFKVMDLLDNHFVLESLINA